jgi:LPS-assembly lipoprotein
MNARLLRFAALGCALLVAAGCGFRLQGHRTLPAVLRVSLIEATDKQSDFVQALRKELLSSGAQLTTQSVDATAVVRVITDNFQRRVLSVSATDQPQEYELTYLVHFSVTAGGKEILADQEVSAVRDLTFDETILLAKNNEEAILRGALAHDLANVVMRRLANL